MSSIIKLGLTATTLEISAVALLLQGKSTVFLVGFLLLILCVNYICGI